MHKAPKEIERQPKIIATATMYVPVFGTLAFALFVITALMI